MLTIGANNFSGDCNRDGDSFDGEEEEKSSPVLARSARGRGSSSWGGRVLGTCSRAAWRLQSGARADFLSRVLLPQALTLFQSKDKTPSQDIFPHPPRRKQARGEAAADGAVARSLGAGHFFLFMETFIFILIMRCRKTLSKHLLNSNVNYAYWKYRCRTTRGCCSTWFIRQRPFTKAQVGFCF